MCPSDLDFLLVNLIRSFLVESMWWGSWEGKDVAQVLLSLLDVGGTKLWIMPI